jgi:hypothetical protein
MERIMSTKKARELVVGDVFRMHIYGEVIAISSVADGKRVKIRIGLEDQGHRTNGGPGFKEANGTLEFTDAGHVLEFLCRPGRKFHTYDDWSDDDDADEGEPIEPTPPHELIDA